MTDPIAPAITSSAADLVLEDAAQSQLPPRPAQRPALSWIIAAVDVEMHGGAVVSLTGWPDQRVSADFVAAHAPSPGDVYALGQSGRALSMTAEAFAQTFA